MSRKNIIIIILVSVALIIGGLLFFYLFSGKTTTAPPVTTSTTSPFGTASGNKPPPTTGTQTTPTGEIPAETKNLSELVQLYRSPTSGSVFFLNGSGQNIIRFTDRAVGHTYEYETESLTGSPKRITNTTVPKIQEAVWSNTGDNLVLRYLENNTDNISSFSAKILLDQTILNVPQELTGSFLSLNTKQLAINPKGDKVFSIVDKSDKSGTYGYTTNLDGSSKKTIFDSPISYWNISWPKDNIVTFTTKPSYMDAGLLYFFNTQNYAFDRILGNITGLSTVTNKDASLVAYSSSINGSFSLDVYSAINKISSGLNITTLADKCVWGNSNSKVLYCAIPQTVLTGNYPDVWYQGLVSFSDNIWKINTETGAMEEIYKIGSNKSVTIDAFDLKISLDDQYLSFSNKSDLSLWLLKLVQ